MQKYLLGILSLLLVLSITSCKTTEKSPRSHKQDSVQKGVNSEGVNNSAFFIDASKQKLLGNYEDAGKLYQKCIDIDPADAASMYELAKIKLIQNLPEDALELSEKAAEIDPYNDYYLFFHASLLQSFERYNDAAKVYIKLVESNPFNLEYYNKLAISYLYAGKMDDAIKVYDDLEDKIGVTEEFSMKKQSIYLQEKKVNKAILEIEKLIEHYPNESKYYAVLAEICLANDMNEKAGWAYQKITEIDPDNPYIHISLADYYRKNGEEEKAFEELKLGFGNPNLDIDSKIQILLTYYTINEIYTDLKGQAFELAELLVETHPDDPKSHSMYGDFLFQDKQYEAARDAFRDVILMDSSKYLVWEQLLFTESELNDVDAMLEESLKTIELFPEQPVPYLFAGGAYYQKKNWDECIEILTRGMKFIVNNTPMEIQIFSYLGDAYNQLKDNEKSDEAYEEALKRDPENDYVLNNYAYYLSLRNENLEKAAKMAKKSTELRPNSPANQDTYGWVLYKMGYYEEAKVWIGKAIEKEDEASPVLLEHYGDVLWQLGDKEEAYKYWIKAKDKGTGSEFLEEKVEKKELIE